MVDQSFPSVMANPTADDHLPATYPDFSPSASCVARAEKKLALMHTSNPSRLAILVGTISTVCHSPSPSGSGPAAETRTSTFGLLRSICTAYTLIGGLSRCTCSY